MRPAFLVWAALLGTGSLALPVQEKGKQQNERLTRSSQFIPQSAFLGNFHGIPVFQQTPVFHQPVAIQDPTFFGQQAFGQQAFGQQAFGPVELVQFQNHGFLQGNNQFQARTGFVEQTAGNIGLDQFQVETFPQANVGVFPNSHEIDTSNLGLNPTKPTRVILQTVPVVVEILDKTTNNNGPELPGTVRTTSSFGAHRFDLGQKKETPAPVKEQESQTAAPVETAKTLSQMIALLGSPIDVISSSASKVDSIGKSATTERLVSEQIKENTQNLPVPNVLASLVAIGTPPNAPVSVLSSSASNVDNIGKSATTEQLFSEQIKENTQNLPVPVVGIATPPNAPVTVQTLEFKKSVALPTTATTEATVTETTVTKIAVTEKPSSIQDNQKSLSARIGELQIPGVVAVDNMQMVLDMIGSSVVPSAQAQVATTEVSKQAAISTEVPVTEEPSAAEQIVLEIMSRLSSQHSEKANDAVEPATIDIPKLLSDQEIVTPVIMVLSPQGGAAQDISLNTQTNAPQPEFVIVLDDTVTSNNVRNKQHPKKMKVGELALKIASESTTVDIPKVKVASSAKNAEKTTNTEAVPVTDPLVDVNQNLISKRLGVTSDNDVGIEHIFLKSTPGTTTNNLVPATVDTEKNSTKTATLEDIMNSLRSQMVAMVSPSGTLILIPMVNLTNEGVTPVQQATPLAEQEGISLANVTATTTVAPQSIATTTEITAPSSTTVASEILASPEALTGIEKIIDAMKAAQNNISLTETPQTKSATAEETVVVTPTEAAEPTNSTTLDTLEKVIETMEAALVNVTANNQTAVPAEVMKMINEVITTMEASLVNVTTGNETELMPETMKTLTQALTNMSNALEALQNVTTSPLDGQQVQVIGQIVPNQGIIPSGSSQIRRQGLVASTPQQEQTVSIRQFVTLPITSSSAQSRSGPPALSPVTVADQVANILRSRISNGATRAAASQVPGEVGFSQRSGGLGQSNQPISLADQLGSEIAHHLIAIF